MLGGKWGSWRYHSPLGQIPHKVSLNLEVLKERQKKEDMTEQEHKVYEEVSPDCEEATGELSLQIMVQNMTNSDVVRFEDLLHDVLDALFPGLDVPPVAIVHYGPFARVALLPVMYCIDEDIRRYLETRPLRVKLDDDTDRVVSLQPHDFLLQPEAPVQAPSPAVPTESQQELMTVLETQLDEYLSSHRLRFLSQSAVGCVAQASSDAEPPTPCVYLWMLRADCWPIGEDKPPNQIGGYPVILRQGHITELLDSSPATKKTQ